MQSQNSELKQLSLTSREAHLHIVCTLAAAEGKLVEKPITVTKVSGRQVVAMYIIIMFPGLSLLFSNIVNSSMLLLLCSFHNWENTSKPLCTRSCTIKLLQWHPFLPAFHPCCHHRWSECHCPHGFTHCCLVVESVDKGILIYCHVMICACAFLLFWHNAHILLACKISILCSA